MTQPFDTSDLKSALEKALGFGLASLTRLDGASALNFKAVRASDGLVFAVKCSPPERHLMHTHLVRHLAEMRGTKAVRRLFEREAPATFRGFDLVCLAWCPGERRFPDTLSDREWCRFLDDYRDFSEAMQRTTLILPHDPHEQWRAAALRDLTGLWSRPLLRLVERDFPISAVTYDPSRIRTVHGDFHHGNFLFENGRVTGFFDLEEFCTGYPTDDLVRYLVCAAEHLRWYQFRRRRRIFAAYRLALERTGYPADEWDVALACLFLRKLHFKTSGRRIGPFRTLNLLFRYRLYEKMRRAAKASAAEGGVQS